MAPRSIDSVQGTRTERLVSKAGTTRVNGPPRQSRRASPNFAAPAGPASRPPSQRASYRPADGRKSTSTRKT
eukprot:6152822-Alexandrium_andersonii.AAC.1